MKLLAMLALGLATGAGATTARAQGDPPPLKTVPQVDLSRYLGTWYEIASFPQRFQRGCTGTTATYSLMDNGDLRVVNRCFKGSLDGKLSVARGHAWVVDKTTNAKLEVSFFWPFHGAYWIIDLDPDYRYAVVGNPSRDYLWILSRTPTMDPAVYAGILERLEAQGFDTSRLVRTLQKR